MPQKLSNNMMYGSGQNPRLCIWASIQPSDVRRPSTPQVSWLGWYLLSSVVWWQSNSQLLRTGSWSSQNSTDTRGSATSQILLSSQVGMICQSILFPQNSIDTRVWATNQTSLISGRHDLSKYTVPTEQHRYQGVSYKSDITVISGRLYYTIISEETCVIIFLVYQSHGVVIHLKI